MYVCYFFLSSKYQKYHLTRYSSAISQRSASSVFLRCPHNQSHFLKLNSIDTSAPVESDELNNIPSPAAYLSQLCLLYSVEISFWHG